MSSSTTSVGDERYAGMEERKRKRMISNRDSARRSRIRKQKVVEDLSNEITRLRCQNNGIVKKIEEAREGYMAVSAQNSVLRSQAEELTERLRSLISVVESVGCNLDIDDGPGALFKPWHPP
ncbi:BZIP transcription factor [Actinidia chinensis var. chinensis]|uniref:BZIP transcription factor n=1 Tax=Actinidia chinensis var. chinensis TaxID=1590841 RepID=A0A2R6RFR7_ACTCC|nr:BZIP transcription factor [Actinidia chinensis var. chinensis]